MDLSSLAQPPDFSVQSRLVIRALAPLSLVDSQPGTYFRSALEPSNSMLYGMLENALGWHLPLKDRKDALKELRKQAKRTHKAHKAEDWLAGKNDVDSGSGYQSLLQHHLKIEPLSLPDMEVTYDDLWSMQLSDNSISFVGGSRNYTYGLESLLNLSKTEDETQPLNKKTKKYPSVVSFGDRKEFVRLSLEELRQINSATQIHVSSLNPHYPLFYSSPRTRGFVVPAGPYEYNLTTSPQLSIQLTEALKNPAAPLYLGTSEGWVEAQLEQL